MEKQLKLALLSILFLALALLLQSTILSRVAISGVKPDLALIILVFLAIRRGSMVGQFAGFGSGLVEDFISLPPLGFYALVRTIIGFLYGLLEGSLVVDSIFMPFLLIAIATLIKGLLIWLVSVVFSIAPIEPLFFGGGFWIEVGYNSLLAPFFFALMNLIKVFKIQGRQRV
jgi:rod shape-determining protein MreD